MDGFSGSRMIGRVGNSDRRHRVIDGALVACLLGCVLLTSCRPGTTPPRPGRPKVRDEDVSASEDVFVPSAETIAGHNRAVGLMGHFDYDAAFLVLEELANDFPGWMGVRVDWAIAALNRRQDGDSKLAAQLLEESARRNPDDLRAQYCLGILNLDAGEPAAALKNFQRVANGDPDDAYAWYYVGQCESQLGQDEAALDHFKQAMREDPYLRSGYYGAFQACARLGQRDESRGYLDEFQRLDGNPQARLAEIKYTRMGPKATLAAIRTTDRHHSSPEKDGPTFLAAAPLVADHDQSSWSDEPAAGRQISVADLQQSGQLTLLFAGAGATIDSPNLLFRQTDQGDWQQIVGHPLSAVTEVNAVCWGDYDNDGLLDAYFCRNGLNQLWRQLAPSQWADVTNATGTSGGDYRTRDAQMFDADHDGDLDLLVINDGPNELLSNNLDGTFRPLGASQGLQGGPVEQSEESADRKLSALGVPSVSSVVLDIDRDRDLDFLVINDQPPHDLYLNDRLWSYQRVSRDSPYRVVLDSLIQAAVAVDLNCDGQDELVVRSPEGIQMVTSGPTGTWTASPIVVEGLDALAHRPALAISDTDGDGQLDLVTATATGWHVVRLPDGKTLHRDSGGPLAAWAVANVDPRLGPSIVGLRSGRGLLWKPGPGRHDYLTVSFTGKDEKADQMRSNRSGIGITAAARLGERWISLRTLRSDSGPGQSVQPQAVGLAGGMALDFVRMTWPDGIFQTELALDAAKHHSISETQRQVASCPVVFAWDGQQFQFVTDVLGVGGIGFNVADGQYAEPRPWENLLLPAGCLRVSDGRLKIKVGEPMEEVCYLDAARLIAFDLPAGCQMTIDERFSIGGAPPTGQPIFYERLIVPTSATNERGESVLDRIVTADLRAVEPAAADVRFIGRTKPHSLELEFAEAINAAESSQRPFLLFDGWIEYPYSQTMFAAWQAGATYDAPTLEAYDEDTRKWKTVLEQFGYMAGMPRQAVVPLPQEALPRNTRRLRLSCNVEVYWDRVAMIHSTDPSNVVRFESELVEASVADVGFALRTALPQRLPNYDYGRRSPFWDTRHPRGYYSRFGDALPLVAELDDAVAVIGPGEEVHLEFGAPPPVASGRMRRYVLELNGWCKDMDLYTRDGETVGPLLRRPEVKLSEQQLKRRDALHRANHTRYRGGN